MAIIFFCSP